MRGCGAAGSDGSWADGERGECGVGGQRVRPQVSTCPLGGGPGRLEGGTFHRTRGKGQFGVGGAEVTSLVWPY